MGALPLENASMVASATTEPGEPTSCINENSLWWTFRPDEVTTLRIDQSASSFDAYVAVYAGSSIDDLTEVRCTSEPTRITLHADMTYMFQFGSWSSSAMLLPDDGTTSAVISEGEPWLRFKIARSQTWSEIWWPDVATPPLNDDRADATPIGALPFATWQLLDPLSQESGESLHCYGGQEAQPNAASDAMEEVFGPPSTPEGTAWYRFDAPRSGTVSAWLGFTYDLSLAVFEGEDLVACGVESISEDPFEDGTWRANFPVEAGHVYDIRVSYYRTYRDQDITARLALDWARDGDLSVGAIQVSAPPLGADRSHSISVTLELDGAPEGGAMWRPHACPTPIAVEEACSRIAADLTWFSESDNGSKTIVSTWRAGACTGDVALRMTLIPIDIADLDRSNDVLVETFSLAPASAGAGGCVMYPWIGGRERPI